MLEFINQTLASINQIIWHQFAIYGLLAVGILFSLWTRFSQFRSLTHGIAVVLGRYDKKDDPGAISHFQALSAALSATVGVGNIGGTAIAISLGGMQQAFFSNEAGQGSSPIVHSAAKTDEPVREGIVAGLEPFIDTIVVCTLTGMVILLSGVWNRDADFHQTNLPPVEPVEMGWQIENSEMPTRTDRDWVAGDQVFCLVLVTAENSEVAIPQQAAGTVTDSNGTLAIHWQNIPSESQPVFQDDGIYLTYAGASLTALAFDQAHPGLGRWLVTLATWSFGISTMISWSYYGEQGVRFLFGSRGVFPYRILFCCGILVSCLGLIQSQTELTHLANLGTGVMLWVNVPITLLFASDATKHYNDYFRRLKAGEFDSHYKGSSN